MQSASVRLCTRVSKVSQLHVYLLQQTLNVQQLKVIDQSINLLSNNVFRYHQSWNWFKKVYFRLKHSSACTTTEDSNRPNSPLVVDSRPVTLNDLNASTKCSWHHCLMSGLTASLYHTFFTSCLTSRQRIKWGLDLIVHCKRKCMNTARNKHNVQDENNVKDYSNGASADIHHCSCAVCVCASVHTRVKVPQRYLLQQTFSHSKWSVSQSIY